MYSHLTNDKGGSGDRMGFFFSFLFFLHKSVESTAYLPGKKSLSLPRPHTYTRIQVGCGSKTRRPWEEYGEHSHSPGVASVYLVRFFLVIQHKARLRAYCILGSALRSTDAKVKKTVPGPGEHTT